MPQKNTYDDFNAVLPSPVDSPVEIVLRTLDIGFASAYIECPESNGQPDMICEQWQRIS